MEDPLGCAIFSLGSACTRVALAQEEREEIRPLFMKDLDVDLTVRGLPTTGATRVTLANSKLHLEQNLCLELADFLKICTWILADFTDKLSKEERNKISQHHRDPDIFKEAYRVAHRAHILVERCFEVKWWQTLFTQGCTSHIEEALDVIDDLQWCFAQIWKIHFPGQPSQGLHCFKESFKRCEGLDHRQLWEKLKNHVLVLEEPPQGLPRFKQSLKKCEWLDRSQLLENLKNLVRKEPLTPDDLELSKFLLERIRVQVNQSTPIDIKASLDYRRVCGIQGSHDCFEPKILGAGSSGKVIVFNILSIKCARKAQDILMSSEDVELQEFAKQVSKLSRLSHPHVIKLLGYYNERSSDGAHKGFLLMELMEGSLYDEMRKGCADDKKKPFQYPIAVDIMNQIARAVRYLHENDVAHRDLKCDNVLVSPQSSLPGELTDTNYKDYIRVKLADFDQADFFSSNSLNLQEQKGNLGTTAWRAPEASTKPGATVKVNPKRVDTWAFAMTIYELLSKELSPFHALPGQASHEKRNAILAGERPPIPENCPKLLKDLMKACWRKEALERPDFPEICRRLQDILSFILTGTLSQRNRPGDAESSASLKQPYAVGGVRAVSSLCNSLSNYLWPSRANLSKMQAPVKPSGISEAELQVTKDGVFPKQKHETLTASKVVVGLDFGTTHTAVAYAKVSNPDEIYTIPWPSTSEGGMSHCETPTGTFYKQTPNGDWECPALQESASRHDRRSCRELKQSLTNSDAFGSVDQHVVKYLQNIGNFVLCYLQRYEYPGRESLLMEHLRWCVTYPSSWSNDSKEKFRTCLVHAGLVRGQVQDETYSSSLDMFRESDAAAHYCYNFVTHANLERICVLDVGSWNVQCVFEDWNSEGRAQGIYGANSHYACIPAGIHHLDNSIAMADPCDVKNMQLSNDLCASSSHTELNFKPLVDRVVSFLQEQLQKTDQSNVKRVFVVGGYAKQFYFMEGLKKSFPNFVFKTPRNSGNAVCEGAVALGLMHLDSQFQARTQQDSSSSSEGGGQDTDLDGGRRDGDINPRGQPGSSEKFDPSIPKPSGDADSKGKERSSAKDRMDVDSLTGKMVVALDFGTSQMSFAYVLASCPSEITVCEDLQRRIPDLYYELHHGTLSLRSYGQKAKDDIRNSLSAVGQYVSKLKLHVAVDNVEPELKLHLLEGLTVDDVISDCLREYGQFILQQLREKFDKKFEFHHIQWCLLVPSFWGENAKLRMKACMINAGLLKGASNVDGSPYPLVTVLEAEAASIACVRSLSLHKGRYLVASIGGGTLDMVTVERIGEAEMYDMLESSMGRGGYCGSFCLDLNFLALLSMKMGAWISEFLKQNPLELNNLMLQWEQIKMEFPNGSGLTLHFLKTIQNSWESFERTSTFGQVRESYKSLQLTIDDVKMVFEPVVQTILELIASQLARANHINALVLVGGFAESSYLLEHIKHRFCDQVEVKPAESKLAVLKGAVSFALHPKEIRSRIVRKTYGLGMSMDFQAGLYSSGEEINEVERFRIDVKKGSRVEVDFCESSVHRPLHFGQKDMKFSLYSSDESYPRYTNEESVTKEWDFVVDISGSVNLEEKPEIRIDLYYGRSAIEVEARAVNFGDDCNPLPVRFVVGSVYERNTMVTNVAEKSYGIGAHKSLALWDLPEYQVKRVDDEDLCNFSFETFIRMGTQLDHFASRTIYPIYSKQPTLLFKLYSSSETSPVYTTDDTVVEEGVLEIDISKGLYLDMDRKVSVRMWFSRTEIKISSVALNFAKPEERNLPIRLRNGRWENEVTLNLARHLRVVPPQSETLPELQTDTRVPIDDMDKDMEEDMEDKEEDMEDKEEDMEEDIEEDMVEGMEGDMEEDMEEDIEDDMDEDDLCHWNMVDSFIHDLDGVPLSEYLDDMSQVNGSPSSCLPNFPSTSNDPFHTVELSNIAQATEGSDLNNFPTGPALQGQNVDDYGAQGEVKDPEVHVNPSKRRDRARANNNSAKPKRFRGPNWKEEEKHALLVYKLEALKRGKSLTKGASWSSHVSKSLLEKHNFDRGSTSCQQQWDTLKKQHDIIQDHESKIMKGTSSCASYWNMEDNEICELNLKLPLNEKVPRRFYFGWYLLMEEIMRTSLDAKKSPTIPRTTSILVGANVASTSTPVPSTTTVTPEPILLPASDGRISPFSSPDIQISTQLPPQALCINSGSQQHEQEVLGITPCTQGSQPHPECIEDMPSNDLNSRIAPLVDKLIEDKFEDKFESLKSILLSREENEQKYRDKLLAIKREKLAIRQQEVEYLTRRVATSCIIDTDLLPQEQVGAACNLASTSNLSQGEHIAGGHGDVRIMQDDQFLT